MAIISFIIRIKERVQYNRKVLPGARSSETVDFGPVGWTELHHAAGCVSENVKTCPFASVFLAESFKRQESLLQLSAAK